MGFPQPVEAAGAGRWCRRRAGAGFVGRQAAVGLDSFCVSPATASQPGSASDRNSIWRLVIPIAILALVIGTTLGEVWHRHANTSPENCPICHLSHQAVEPAVTSLTAEILVPEGPGPEPLEIWSMLRVVSPRLPARAPPA